MDFKFQYDPTLLHISGATLASALPGDWAITSNNVVAGQLVVSASGVTPLSGSNVPLVLISADVPATAPYGAIEVLRLQNGLVGVQSGLTVVPAAATGDFAIHKNVYLGDVDGSGIYTGFDVALISRVVVGLDSGFDAASWTDPVIVGGVIGTGAQWRRCCRRGAKIGQLTDTANSRSARHSACSQWWRQRHHSIGLQRNDFRGCDAQSGGGGIGFLRTDAVNR